MSYSIPTLLIITACATGGSVVALSASESEPRIAHAVSLQDAAFLQNTFARLAYLISATEMAEIHAVNHPWAGEMGALKTDASKMRNDLMALMKVKVVGIQMLQPEIAGKLDALSKTDPDRAFTRYRKDQLDNLAEMIALLSKVADGASDDADLKACAVAWAPIIARQHEALQNAERALPSE